MSAWQRLTGPDDTYQVCGDDAVFEIGSVYGFGTPDAEPRCEWECEVVYYVEEADKAETVPPLGRRWVVSEMSHSYRNVDDDSADDEYDYQSGGCALFHHSLEEAEACARRLAAEDESWKLAHWDPTKNLSQ